MTSSILNQKTLSGCLKNEYLIASDENGNNIGMFKCNGHGVEKIPYKAIDTRFAGKVKARNPQQELAIDMLYDEDTTVKSLQESLEQVKTS